MSKEYKKVIIFILVLVVLVGTGIFIYYQKTKLPPGLKELLTLKEGRVLPEDQLNKFDRARAVLEKNPRDPQAIIDIAQVKYRGRDFTGAAKAYLMALEIQPQNSLILNNLGDIYNQKGEYQKSAEMYSRLIKANPKWINAYRELERIYYYQLPEKYPQMEEILLKGLEKNKEFSGERLVDFYALLAGFYKKTEKVDKAIEYYEKAIELAPGDEGVKRELEELRKNL